MYKFSSSTAKLPLIIGQLLNLIYTSVQKVRYMYVGGHECFAISRQALVCMYT